MLEESTGVNHSMLMLDEACYQHTTIGAMKRGAGPSHSANAVD